MLIADVKKSVLLSDIVAKSAKLEKRGKEFWCCCPFHGEATPSFCIQDWKGKFNCYGCGLYGDVIDFVQKIHNVTMREACAILTNYKPPEGFQAVEFEPAVDDYASLIAIAAKENDLPRPGQKLYCWNPKKGWISSYVPELVHPYRRLDGSIMGCTIRADLPEKKIVPMLQMISHGGRRMWSHFPFKSPRPLYGLEQFAVPVKTAPRIVIVVEGEKCADIARRHLHNHTVVTWAGGGKAVRFADYSPLRDCSVLLWPDADQEGMDTMLGYAGKTMNTDQRVEGVADLVRRAGAAQVRCLGWDKTKPKGWDVGDAIMRDGMSYDEINKWMRRNSA